MTKRSRKSKPHINKRKILDDLIDWVEDESTSSYHTDECPIVWVHDFTEETARDFNQNLYRLEQDKRVEKILIKIDSYGGEIYSLLSMLEAIKNCTKPIYTACSGKAMSAGAVLLSAGDKRFMGRYSTVMIHQANGGTDGRNSDVQADAKELDRLHDIVLGILAKNCATTKQILKQLIKENNGADMFFTARQALDFGLIDQIGLPQVKKITRWDIIGVDDD